MSRKKATRRKIKVTDSYSRHSPNSNTMDHVQKSSKEYLPPTDNFHSEQDLTVDSMASQNTTLMPAHWNEQNHSGGISSSAVKVKTEPNLDMGHLTCSSENNVQNQDIPASKQDTTSTFKPAKIKRERLSLDSSVPSRSTYQFPTMDLGSHLEQSLNSLKSGPELTWSQLLEAKNLPKVHIPERLLSKVVNIKTEKPDSGSDVVLCSTDDDTENPSVDLSIDKSSSLGKSSTVTAKEKISGTGLSGSGTGLTGSGNRFSKNHEGGSGVLDLSKKAIPPEIRRVLASKYGVAKRHEEGHTGNFVPNLSKSRSRFIHSSKKAGITDSEDEGNNQIETAKSGQLSNMDARQGSESERRSTQTSTSSSQELKPSSGMPKSKSVSPTEYAGSIPVPAKLFNRRRFSSSTYEGRRSTQSLDHREPVTDRLQSRGLVDLGSHYVSLLKDSPPPLAGRNSRSPYEESEALGRGGEDSSILDKGVVQDAKNMRQSAFDDRNTGPTKSGPSVVKRLPQGVRRSSFGGDSTENSRSLNSRGEALYHGGAKKSNEAAGPPRAAGRNSKSPVDFDSRNAEETMVGLGSTSRFGQLRDAQHRSARSSSR